MSYEAVESGLLTLIRGLSNYSATNADRGDYRILAAGNTRAVVINPGSIISRDVIALPRRVSTEWELLIELFIPFTGEVSTAASAIRVDRQELLDLLDKYPTLNGVTNVVHAFVVGGSDPEIWAGESSNYWKQTLSMRVTENTNTAIAE